MGAFHKPNQAILPVNRWQTKIKLDISFTEQLLMIPEQKNIFHSYSDCEIIKSIVPVYQIIEIVAEKLRSLLQRNRPRDIYDLYYLSGIITKDNYLEILSLLKQKAKSKSIDFSNYNDFVNQNKYNSNKRAWESSLAYHLPKGQLIDYDIAFSKVEDFVKNILKQTV